jgi:tetratricopeptide (TPR) repeat protein
MQSNKIIDYSEFISKSTVGFVDREWVRDAVDEFLDATDPRFFLLLGEPGCGKTTFMANLISQRGYPHHFIGKGSQSTLTSPSEWRDPVRFAESIGYQLLRDYGGWVMRWEDWGISVSQEVQELEGLLVGSKVRRYQATPRLAEKPNISVEQEVERFGAAGRVIGVYIEHLEMDVERIVRQLVTVPLQAIAERWPQHQVVVVIDGLDEAADYSNPQHNILALLPNEGLPSNVRFLLSSRPGKHLATSFLDQSQVFWLSEDRQGGLDPRTIEDAQAYVSRLSRETSVRQMLDRAKISPDALIERVAHASQGNFLYLHHYAQGIRGGDTTLLDLEALPEGLYGIYGDFLTKIRGQRGDVPWDSAYKPVLGAMAVLQEPVTRAQIAGFSGVAPGTVGTILVQIDQFLEPVGQGRSRRYGIFHTSFGEYLLSEENEDYIDGQEAHARVVQNYRRGVSSWAEVDWSWVDDYGFRYLAYHLRGAGAKEELYLLLTGSPDWMNRKFRAFMNDHPYQTDLDMAISDLGDQLSASEVPKLVKLHTARQVVNTRTSGYSDQMLQVLALLGRQDQALEIARLRGDLRYRFRGLLAVCNALRRQGQPVAGLLSEAKELLRTISPDHTWVDEENLSLAKALAGVGRSDEALEAARDIEVSPWRIEALTYLAAALARTEEQGRADDVLDEAMRVALDTRDEELREHAVGYLTTVLIDARRYDLALQLARGLESDYERARTLTSIAVALIKKEERYDQALELARECAVDRDSVERLFAVLIHEVRVRTQAGNEQEASTLLDKVRDAAQRIEYHPPQFEGLEMTLENARAFADEGREALPFKAAVRRARAAENETERIRALTTLSLTLKEAGDERGAKELLDDVLEVAQHSKDFDNIDWELSTVASVLLRSGLYDWAAQVARIIRDGQLQALALHPSVKGLADLGRYDLALEVARDIESDPWRIDALSYVATALAEAGEQGRAEGLFVEAVRATQDIPIDWQQAEQLHLRPQHAMAPYVKPWERPAEPLDSVAGALAEAGRYNLALEVAREIESDQERAEAWISVTEILAKRGHCDQALEAFRDTQNEQGHGITSTYVVATLAEQGCREEALAIAREIESDQDRAEALTYVAAALAEAGERDRAEELFVEAAKTARDTQVRWELQAFTSLAESLAEGGRCDLALEVVRDGQNSWDGWPDIDEWQHFTLINVAAALAEVGHCDEAAEVAREIESDQDRAEALTYVAAALAEAGERGRAEGLLDEAVRATRAIQVDWQREDRKLWPDSMPYLEPWSTRAERLTYIVEALAEAGHYDEALKVARDIEWNWLQAEALTLVAQTLAEAGEQDRAEALLDEAVKVTRAMEGYVYWQQAKVSTSLTKALAGVGRYDEALKVAGDIKLDQDRAEALAHVAQTLAERDRLDEALKVTGDIKLDQEQAETLAHVAQTLAERDRLDEALKVARDIKLDQEQAEALAHVAHTLADAGEQGRAQALFGEAVRIARTRPRGKVLTFLRDVGRISDALALLALADFHDINEFLQNLVMWVPTFEQLQSGLSVIALREFTEVAGWSNSHWRRVHELIQMAEPAK